MSVEPDPETTPGSDPAAAAAAEPAQDLGYRRWDCTGDDPEALARAADDARDAIENGECIVLPTDTVYGIGADAFNPDAVQRLLDAKVRGRDMPPPVLIGEPSLIRALAVDIPDEARQLVAAHWPGPLTIILKRQPSLKMDLGETEGTVALRVPDHELARDILRATGPMAVSSANISGLPAALTCDEAIDQLGASVSVYLDGGRVGADGQPSSTIVDFTQTDHGQILRRGALGLAALAETLPEIEDLVAEEDEDEPDGSSEEPAEEPGEPSDPDATDPTDGEDPGPESADDIRAEIESVGEPDAEPDEPDAQTDEPEAEEHRAEANPADQPSWHEPTTDELRITHPDHDIDQPDLFEGSDDEGSSSGDRGTGAAPAAVSDPRT
ncbi:MAG TPA: L-threonylcarbamoyladenylate synthase [Microlunatus sp.]|nr:L-threonylcarbamoyladenylate synthase [Microlunatus sp.]